MAGTGAADPSAARARLESELGVPLDAEFVVLALTHRSYAYENGGLPTNERLEFLGDSVLGVVVTEALYRDHPDLPEGQLAKLRASIVNMHALAGVARTIGLGDLLRLGRGEELTGGRDKAVDPGRRRGGHCSVRSTCSTVWSRPARCILRLFAELIDVGTAAGRRPGLEDLAAGAGRRPRSRRARVPGDRGRARPRQDVHRRRRLLRRRARRRVGTDQEGSRAAGRGRRLPAAA